MGKTIKTEPLYKKHLPLDGRTMHAKTSSQPVNLAGTQSLMKALDILLHRMQDVGRTREEFVNHELQVVYKIL